MITPPLKIKIINTSIHSFHFFGAIGFFLGLFLGVALAYATVLSMWTVVLCSLVGAGVLFGMTYLYKVLTGREDLVYYQHEIAILVCCLITLSLLNQPILSYLDITIMGIGVFLVFGRIGCFSVGCCHGRIGKVGVKYTDAHVAEGFHRHFAGVPIFPIQLIESGCVLVTVFIGTYIILKDYLPGTALLFYTIFYGAVRFVLEFYRGDTDRPYWFGFSEAQWTTFGIFVISLVLSFYGLLPHYLWHLWALPLLVLVMVTTVTFRKFQNVPKYKILHPKHILEIAKGIEALEYYIPINGEIFMVSTSLNMNISRGILELEQKPFVHYTISSNDKIKFDIDKNSAKLIGKLIQTLKYPTEDFEIEEGGQGVYHLIFPLFIPKNKTSIETSISDALSLRRDLRNSYN